MSYPAPPGLKSSTTQPPASLPARPPPSSVSPAPTFKSNSAAKPAFTAFAPRSVVSASTSRTNSPAQYSAAPITNYSASTGYPQTQSNYATQPQYDSSYLAAPQIRNPFVPTSETSSYPPGYDPDYEAQVQQWQSAYLTKDSGPGSSTTIRPPITNIVPAVSNAKTEPIPHNEAGNKTVQRSGGGTTWTDPTLLEWDPAHFRIFVGNLAGEVTDESLLKAFSQYPSVQKARVIRDKRTTKSKGYGFVSFSDGDDYFRAAREQNGKYVGSHPIVVKKAVTDVRPTIQKQNNHKGKGKGGHGKVEHGGVNKKQPKTKGGLKVLG
ncbi:uncharacterized protein A1O9_04817 [Exophiala aquamarina CBS 119918]|uniref:RRM domain-containing protein n=1 Tax=Exophiala aquamarina CBS 119918 TaxID=1182545 RepID=A0A072PIM1_9EURO|nr:uncharacterized protein A1O9_04817 [Exophiala aquamarina CBS 119918]KEF59969.1 hypothetical protein A1O9_04817 [Exophiala aquamarina CBS 119918]